MARQYKQENPTVDLEFQDVDSRLSSLELDEKVKVGSMLLWCGGPIPNKWLSCDGKSYAIATYPELFKVLERRAGTPSPASESNFKVPDVTVGSFRFIIRAIK